MKHLKLSIIFLVALASSSFSQIEIASRVKEATLFSNKAQITRVETVKLNKGDNIVQFTGLESSIDNNSVQVSATNQVTVISNFIQMTNTKQSSQPMQIRLILDSIKILKREEQLGRKRIQNLEAEKNMILYNKSANGVNSGFNLDNMIDLAEYYRNNLDKIDVLVYNENEKVLQNRAQSSELNQRLTKLGYKTRANSLFATVFSERAQTVSIKLVYLVNNIGWTPFYEIKSNGIGSEINAICKASINQNSQVDWKDVSLTLSTSNPMNFGTLPTVHPWVLRFQRDARKYKKSQAYNQGAISNRQMNSSYEVATEKGYNSKSMASYATATDNMVNREFNISKPYSIKGSNGKAVVDLEDYSFKVDYVYYAAPKYSCDVFLIAHINNWEKYNLLPGTANLFLEGTFVGTTMINPNSTSDTMSLVLGKDRGIVAKREKIKDVSRKAILGSSKKVDMGIQITVKNNKGKDIEIIVEDQVPITSDEKIEISIKDISKASKEDDTGKLTWKYTLKAGETKIHKIKYEVKHPKNKPLSNF
ncbi:MAG: DUF4139 domain-containing protein [Flavobacteriales bacterium]